MEWFTSAVCEEFHISPVEAERQPAVLCRTIMAQRRFRDAVNDVEHKKGEELEQDNPWIQRALKCMVATVKGVPMDGI